MDDNGIDDDEEGTSLFGADFSDEGDDTPLSFSDFTLDSESSDDSNIKGFFFCGFSVILLYIMNIIYILVTLY